MRAILALPILALAACGTGGVLLTPAEVVSRAGLTDELEMFCSETFVAGNTASGVAWMEAYNTLAPYADRAPIDVEGLTTGEQAQLARAIRAGICLATQPVPAPAVVEAVEDAA